MNYSNSADADQVIDSVLRTNIGLKMEAQLDIKDVLGFTGPITVEGVELDAVVNVSIVQTGSDKLEIEIFEVVGNVIDMYLNDSTIIYLNYNADGFGTSDTIKKFNTEVERIALEQARNTGEENWNYRLIE